MGKRVRMPYAVYVPAGFPNNRRWPAILFLHGYGERGDDGLRQTRVGLGPAILRHPERFRCVVVMPQAPLSGVRWEGDVNDLALEALEEVVVRYHGDRRPLYLTGCSMGAAGCWRIAAAHPDRFAATMPICGRNRPRELAPRLKDLPIWVFHGARDDVVPVSFSREMVAALRRAGNHRVRYTEYADVGHVSWDRAYGDGAAIEWLLAQRR